MVFAPGFLIEKAQRKARVKKEKAKKKKDDPKFGEGGVQEVSFRTPQKKKKKKNFRSVA